MRNDQSLKLENSNFSRDLPVFLFLDTFESRNRKTTKSLEKIKRCPGTGEMTKTLEYGKCPETGEMTKPLLGKTVSDQGAPNNLEYGRGGH